MKLGYSLLLGELLESQVVGYEDCKGFQIVCPSCKEPVFKVERAAGEAEQHFLSHYEKEKAYVQECELRVKSISSGDINATNAEARGQKLRLFLKVFRDAWVEHFYPDSKESIRRALAELDNSAGVRVLRDVNLQTWRDGTVLSGLDQRFDYYLAANPKAFPSSLLHREMQRRIARDYLGYLMTHKSWKNLCFLFNAGFLNNLHRRQIGDLAGAKMPDYEERIRSIMNALSCATKSNAKEMLYGLSRMRMPGPGLKGEMSGLDRLCSQMTHEMVGVLFMFPFLEILAKHVGGAHAETL